MKKSSACTTLFRSTLTILVCLIALTLSLQGAQMAHAATIDLPNGFGGSDFNTGNSNVINTDLNSYTAPTQEEALNQNFFLGDTSLADRPDDLTTIDGIIVWLAKLLNKLAPFIIALTLLVFIWGLLQLVRAGSDSARKEGKDIIMFGLVGLFIMVSVWGLVNILISSFNLQSSSTAPQGPGVPKFK